MNLVIEQLELKPKNYAHPERRPTLIFLEANEPEMTPHLATVFKAECEALFPQIVERGGLRPDAQLNWSSRLVGSQLCLTTMERSFCDIHVVIAPDIDPEIE